MKAREMAPVAPQAKDSVELRETQTPFAQALAAVLEPTPPNERGVAVRFIAAAEAARLLPRLVERQGLKGRPYTYLRQADGRMTSSWYDAPSIWVNAWASREGAIMVKEDAAGPAEIRFLTQLATDVVRNVMRVGDAEYESREFFRALWDVGIREIRAEVQAELRDVVMTDARRDRLAAIPEVTLTRRLRGDGWTEHTWRIGGRP